MTEYEELWLRSGLTQFQVVRCVVTGHRRDWGIDVEIVAAPDPRAVGHAAFIDFVLLAERGVQVTPEVFPPVGSELDAVVIDFMPNEELRLDATPSAVAQRKKEQGLV